MKGVSVVKVCRFTKDSYMFFEKLENAKHFMNECNDIGMPTTLLRGTAANTIVERFTDGFGKFYGDIQEDLGYEN